MCGIVGIADLDGAIDRALLQRMTNIIAHRGPDGEGHHVAGQVGLGHRRLAIVDLSPAGAQPMLNERGDLAITYNGEVYNFRELRTELEARGRTFRSQTDTEVVLQGYDQWGPSVVERLDGMFAFAIHDRRDGADRLFLARDRFGVKPLYYSHRPTLFLFASEVKAILEHPRVERRMCYPALSEYFAFQNIFSDLTLFDGVRLLPPGCMMHVELGDEVGLSVHRYWEYRPQIPASLPARDDLRDELRGRFEEAVSRQLMGDVPVGSYLSGGMDSGSITAVAARRIPRLHTFSCGFDLSSATGLEMNFDERPAAESMANLFKTEHYEVVLHAGDMEHVLPELVWHLEDLRVGQCYPNYYVARLASKFVKVVQSGAGGDELFGGYPWRYYRGARARTREEYYQACYEYWQRLIPDNDREKFFSEETYAQVKGHDPFSSFRRVFERTELPIDSLEDRINASLCFELRTFLPGLLLVEDKISMAHGLETRVPFLDNALADLAMRIPPRFKLRDLENTPNVSEDEPAKLRKYHAQPNSDGKVILREAMATILPGNIATRVKQGFSAPDASWFRGESIAYVRRLLGDPEARLYTYVRRPYVDQVLHEHASGRVNHRLLIWSLLCFEHWLRIFDVRS